MIKLAQKHAYQTDQCLIGDTPKVKPKQDALRVLSSLLTLQVPKNIMLPIVERLHQVETVVRQIIYMYFNIYIFKPNIFFF